MQATYTTSNTEPAYQLNWGLTLFWRQSPIDEDQWLDKLKLATEPDGVRILRHRVSAENTSQFFVSTKPHVKPSELIRSVKGRLQHEIQSNMHKAFQRNYALRSIGESRRSVVEDYVANQLRHHVMADSGVQDRLARYQKVYEAVDLSKPQLSAHGKFWHNLHVVIVNESRWMEIQDDILTRLNRIIEGLADKHAYRLSRVGLLPDHIHLVVGCPIDHSPEEVALCVLNNCAYVYGMKPAYQFGYYVGTIGEYDRGAIQS